MKKYAVISDNETSEWDDETGARYHFPIKFKGLLTTGTKIVYYKKKANITSQFRLMDSQHYFGYATIGKVYVDSENPKNLYAEIEDYKQFSKGVFFKKEDGIYFENVSKSNYWRDGARKITSQIYNDILFSAGVNDEVKISATMDIPQLELTQNSIIKYKITNDENIIKNFIPNSIDIKKIGDRGEELVLEYLKNNLHVEEVKTLKWLANEGETPGYDIEYLNLNQQKVCIEVKSTTGKKFPYFHLTINEYNASQQNELYYIYLVSNCKSKNPKVEILDNPFIKDNFKLEPIVFKVYQLEDI